MIRFEKVTLYPCRMFGGWYLWLWDEAVSAPLEQYHNVINGYGYFACGLFGVGGTVHDHGGVECRRGSSKFMTRVPLNTPAVFLNTYRKYLFKFITVASGFHRGV